MSSIFRSFVYNREGWREKGTGMGEADSPSPFLVADLAPCFQVQGPATGAILKDSIFV